MAMQPWGGAGPPGLGGPPGMPSMPGMPHGLPSGMPPLPSLAGLPPNLLASLRPPGGLPNGMPGLPGMPPGLGGFPGMPPGMMPPGMPPMPGLPGMPPGMPPMPGMPSMPGMPGMPGMPPPPAGGMPGMPGMPPGHPGPPGAGGGDINAQMTRWAADAYDQAKTAGISPEIAELTEHFGIDERATQALNQEMRKRAATFKEDMEALWIGLEGARNPSGMLMLKVKDMMQGSFRGMSALDKEVQDFAKRYKLDAQAGIKLAEVMQKREETRESDMIKIGKHLERSNKPSALMMQMLKSLREGKPVKEPEYAAAIGSRVHEKEVDKEFKDKNPWKKDGRSRSRQRQRGSPKRERERDRDRDRDRDRRDRSRDRKRSRSRRR